MFFLLITGCATVGPIIIIETDEPAEDFVVLCKKDKSYLFKVGHTASRYTEVDHVIVAKSGKEVDCGLMVGGTNGNVTILHPTLTGSGGVKNYIKDGVRHIYYDKTKLDILDEKKAKFDSGYWDEYKWPGSEYATQVQLVCGFPRQYLNYYIQEKDQIDVERFKQEYDEDMYLCIDRVYKVMKKYYRGFSQKADARKTMDMQWDKLRKGVYE